MAQPVTWPTVGARESLPRGRKRRTEIALDVALMVGSLVLVFGGAEIGLRVLGRPRSMHGTRIEVNLDRLYVQRTGGEPPAWIQPDPDLLWKLAPHMRQELQAPGAPRWLLTTNGRGLRGREIPAVPGRPLILCAGDSCTLGYGVDDADAYPAVLEALLRGQPGLERAETVNLGISGYSSEQGRVTVARHVAELSPDVVIIDYGINDDWPCAFSDTALIGGNRLVHRVREALRKSNLYCALRNRIVRARWSRIEAHHEEGPRVTPGRYEENLGAMVADVRAHGGVPMFVAPTSKLQHFQFSHSIHLMYPLSVYRKAMEAVSVAEKVPVLEVDELVGRKRETGYLFSDYFHPNEEGLCILARDLVPLVVDAIHRRRATR